MAECIKTVNTVITPYSAMAYASEWQVGIGEVSYYVIYTDSS